MRRRRVWTGGGGRGKKKKGREKNPHRIKHVRMIRVLRFEGERRRGGGKQGEGEIGRTEDTEEGGEAWFELNE